ncbi:hypothetical protein C8039_01285 [Halogeometricum sp. wsp3]|nr:hypothetical protein C8039_01285 [Halogeometricum sp. wsp3]
MNLTGRLVEEVEEDPFAYLPVLVVVTRPDEDGVPGWTRRCQAGKSDVRADGGISRYSSPR